MLKWMKKPHIIIVFGVGVGVACAIKVLRRQNNNEFIRTESNRISRAIKIPKGFVGHVLGRGGTTIKLIREKSKAKITFDDSENEFTIAVISGSPESVEKAAELINEILSNRHACVTKEIILTENISDSVWKNINCIRQICDLTRAKIIFDFTPSKNKVSQVKICIKGKKEEVDAAVELVDELVAEVEINTSKQIHVAGRALPENLPLHSSTLGFRNLPSEKLIPNSSDGFLEVYVSAVENPNKFWVQISGSKSIQLDKLATEMTEFYNEAKNKDKFQLNSISVGDIVAAFFAGDNSWYRAQVVKVSTNDDGQKQISVFYLDFGDCANLNSDLVSVLKPDFLSIPFQAIECSLYDVEPIGDKWTDAAIAEFETLAHASQWKVLMAKPHQKPAQNGENSSQDSVQFVQLMDTNTTRDINISEELVIRAFAKFV